MSLTNVATGDYTVYDQSKPILEQIKVIRTEGFADWDLLGYFVSYSREYFKPILVGADLYEIESYVSSTSFKTYTVTRKKDNTKAKGYYLNDLFSEIMKKVNNDGEANRV